MDSFNISGIKAADMTTKQFATLLVLTSLALISCNKHYSANPDSKTKDKVSLTGLQTHELFKTKYDRLQAVCHIQDGHDWNQDIRWDLLADPVDEKTLKGENPENEFTLLVHFSNLQVLGKRTYFDPDGHSYRMKNSPEIQVSVKWIHGLKSDEGIGGRVSGKYQQILVEGVPPVTYESSTELHPEHEIAHDTLRPAQRTTIDCSLETQIKKDYQDEFSKDEIAK